MFDIILHHEVMKKAISLKILPRGSHKYGLSTILSIFDSLETLTFVTMAHKNPQLIHLSAM